MKMGAWIKPIFFGVTLLGCCGLALPLNAAEESKYAQKLESHYELKTICGVSFRDTNSSDLKR